ncbi:MAG: hypothetical protein HYY90_03585 [Candidatus Omnitrophica bacterium]|nr:hypothetical protein [Candidatus Omnitrophota bacterium]MBI2495974.1 hypothetical protein [Candidatus Omnitrophota bacterium]MBI3021217.1 hypothetical protein [Candidatus Omnitrophota bacterium]MBI3083423.1 hypothetical protein [Candidatus Omnitrophota bacterium]
MKRIHRPSRSSGTRAGLVQLPELILLVLLLSLVTGLLVTTSLGSQRTYATSDAILQVQGEARRAFDSMLTELRQAGGAITTGASQLDFQFALGYNQPLPCPANAECWGAYDQAGARQAGWRVRYRLDGVNSQLLREIVDNAGAVQPGTRVLANRISQASFTYVAGATRTVTIALQAQRTSAELPGGSVTVSPIPLVMRLRLRNS